MISKIAMALAILNAECRVSCLYRGFDFGTYEKKDNRCACITYVDYDTACMKYVPKRSDGGEVNEYSRGDY